jgi:antitoxin component HigA of HigAB toxin-antitoxin module
MEGAILMRPIMSTPQMRDAYLALVQEFPLCRLRDDEQYEAAMKMLLKSSTASETNDGALEYFRVLVDQVDEYERRTGKKLDTSHITTADLVRFKLEERGMSISQLAREVKMTQSNLSEMLNGKRAWSKSAIRKLSAYLNISAERFLREEKKR